MATSWKNRGIIRLATPPDLSGALALEGEVTGLSSSRARELLTNAITAQECLVDVDEKNEVVGFVIMTARTFFGHDFIKLLVVSPAHQRRGVGRSLVRASVRRARTEKVFSSTNESNLAMRALFDKDGWLLSGTLTGIDEGDPELVFWRDTSS